MKTVAETLGISEESLERIRAAMEEDSTTRGMKPGEPPLSHWKPFRLVITGWTTTSQDDIRKRTFGLLSALDEVPEVAITDEEDRPLCIDHIEEELDKKNLEAGQLIRVVAEHECEYNQDVQS